MRYDFALPFFHVLTSMNKRIFFLTVSPYLPLSMPPIAPEQKRQNIIKIQTKRDFNLRI